MTPPERKRSGRKRRGEKTKQAVKSKSGLTGPFSRCQSRSELLFAYAVLRLSLACVCSSGAAASTVLQAGEILPTLHILPPPVLRHTHSRMWVSFFSCV